jgi:hypothetical protein
MNTNFTTNHDLASAVRKAKEIHGNPLPKIASGISYTIDPVTLKKIIK